MSKYADHLPLYRQAQIFVRQGVNLDRSTLVDWVGRAAPVLEPVHGRLRQKSTLAVAIRYATSPWAGLTLYVEDGRVQMDSNTVERAIRPLALTRKNALFAGSDRGGRTWAVTASLVETYKLNGVDPQGYLTDVIARIVGGHPQSRLDELMPWAYPTISGIKVAA